MFSTPLISCSSGAATVSAITFGFAPGYCARTTTVGGTTSGYSEIGSWNDGDRADDEDDDREDRREDGAVDEESRDLHRALPCAPAGSVEPWSVAAMATTSGATDHAGAHALQAANDDALRRREALADHAQPVVHRAELHAAVLHLVVLVDDEHEAPVLVGSDGAIRDEDRRPRGAPLREAHAREEPRRELAVGVLDDQADLRRPRRRVGAVVDEVEGRLVRVAVLVREADLGHERSVRGRAAGARPGEAQRPRLFDVDVDVERVDRDERGQRAAARGRGADEVAGRHQQAPDAPRDRRANRGVLDVEAGRGDVRRGHLLRRRELLQGAASACPTLARRWRLS